MFLHSLAIWSVIVTFFCKMAARWSALGRYHPHLRQEEGRRFNARECTSLACLLPSLARTVSHETPSPSNYKGFWEGECLAKKEHITVIVLANHDLSLEAEHTTTLHKHFNRDYPGDNQYFIIITINYFKPNYKNVLNEWVNKPPNKLAIWPSGWLYWEPRRDGNTYVSDLRSGPFRVSAMTEEGTVILS